MGWQVIDGDALTRLRELDEASVQTCVTSPPYFGLRDYGNDGQIGLEPTPDLYVASLVEVFREVRRVLRDDGTLWLNLGDSYSMLARSLWNGCKPKDLIGIPWMVAFALRADGWYLRSDIIWSKPNPMPESVTDRPTKAHEYLFLLSKGPRYMYDADAIREAPSESSGGYQSRARKRREGGEVTWSPSTDSVKAVTDPSSLAHRSADRRDAGEIWTPDAGRNRRSVWTVATQPFPGAHFAVFPPRLIEPCVLAGSAEGDTVLDPFAGAGTTGVVATRHGRGFIGVELNPGYAEMARERIRQDAPLFNYLGEAA